jgi:hypothetical protein
MKQTLSLRTFLCLAVVQLLLCPTLHAGVTFTVTPTAVSNTYNGVIKLQVKGLTTGETVVVQEFIDLNGNGVIDAGDWLVQQFQLTDGQAGMVIGGIVNSNVPGDTDSTAGQIAAQLNFNNGDLAQQFSAKYLYKLSSPTGRFTPITNPFSVTSFPYAQKFTGNVVSSGTDTTVPNAIVLLLNGNGSGVEGAVADNSGSYTIQAPPGAYTLIAFKSNYVFNVSAQPVLTLGSGQTATTNLTVANATASISGMLVDANNRAIGLPGVLVSAQADNGVMAVTVTDTNGSFTLGVQSGAGPWGLYFDQKTLITQGYVGLQNGTNVAAGATGITLAVPRATALFYGSVKDNLGNSLPGVEVEADDNNGLYACDGYTDANGNYFAAVLGGLGSNDLWYVDVSSDHSPANYIFSQPAFDQNGGANVSNGQAAPASFTALPAANHITGYLKDNNNNPISGVGVWASATINGVQYNQGSVDTDANGSYSLNVANGTWTVGVNSGGGGDSLPSNYLSPPQQTVVISNKDGTANFTTLVANSLITGHVQEANGAPIPSLGVEATATINGVMYFSGTGPGSNGGTDGNGDYSLSVANGDWTVGVFCQGCPCGSLSSLDNIFGSGNYECPNNQNVTIYNDNATNNFTVQLCTGVAITTTSLPAGQVNVYYDQFLQASSCNPTFTWSLVSGSPPPGLTGDPSGEIYGTPTNAGKFTFTVQVTDGNGDSTNQTLSIYIAPSSSPLQVATSYLPNATNGVFYSQALQASGGQTPYRWSIPDYSVGPPPDLTLSPSGVLSGTPETNAGSYGFYVRVTDAASNEADSPNPLLLNIVNPPLQITNVTLPGGAVGAFYSAQLGAIGGQPPYSWGLAVASAGLPGGLSLDLAGLISGTPTNSKASTFRVEATDANHDTAYQVLSITINPALVLGSPSWQGNRFQMRLTGATGQNYTVQMSTNLRSTNWTSLFVTNSATTNSFIVIDPNATDKQRFYRVEAGP